MVDEKLVPKLRFSGFDDEWEIKKLDELSKIQRGASPRPISSKKNGMILKIKLLVGLE